ncbi:MAG: hypothetical protein ABSB76_17700 [Streptosporangiaceae bacterium]
MQTAEPLDLDDKHEIIRRVHQERDQAPRHRYCTGSTNAAPQDADLVSVAVDAS